VNQYAEEQLDWDFGRFVLNRMEISAFDEISGCFASSYAIQITEEIRNSFDMRCIAILEHQALMRDTLTDLKSSGLVFGTSGTGRNKKVTLVLAQTTVATRTTKTSSPATRPAVVTTTPGGSSLGSNNAQESGYTSIILIAFVVLLLISGTTWVCMPKRQPSSENLQQFQPVTHQDPETPLPPPVDTHVVKKPTRASIRNPRTGTGKSSKSVSFGKSPEKPSAKSIFADEDQPTSLPAKKTVTGFNLDYGDDLPFSIVTLGGMRVNGFEDADDYGESSF
jgi:hypothetical protein